MMNETNYLDWRHNFGGWAIGGRETFMRKARARVPNVGKVHFATQDQVIIPNFDVMHLLNGSISMSRGFKKETHIDARQLDLLDLI